MSERRRPLRRAEALRQVHVRLGVDALVGRVLSRQAPGLEAASVIDAGELAERFDEGVRLVVVARVGVQRMGAEFAAAHMAGTGSEHCIRLVRRNSVTVSGSAVGR